MSSKRIYLSSPHMGEDELSYIHHAFNKNWIAPLGDNVDGFEQDLAGYTGTKHAAALSSGTAAIHLALIQIGVKEGDEVICQSFTFSATANPIRYQGATPVFIDSEPETWNMCPELLEKALEERRKEAQRHKGTEAQRDRGSKMPKAVIVVDLYGMPAKMGEIREVAGRYGVPVIEDAAEALGSHIGGEMCGSFGEMGVLSFNGNKIITTSGGGALVSDSEEYINQARFLATQARDPAPHYQHSHIGYNYRMSNVLAGIGRGQMKVLDQRVKQRRAVFEYYFERLGETWLDGSRFKVQGSRVDWQNSGSSSSYGLYFLKEPEGYHSNRWLTTILVNPDETGGVTREDIRLALEEENIESRPLWKPMHRQPVFEGYPFYGNGVSDFLFEYGLCLPSGSNMSRESQDRVVNVVKKVLSGSPNRKS